MIQDLEGEVWYDLPIFNGCYLFSNKKRLKSLPRNGTIKKERLLKFYLSKYGYLYRCINVKGVKVNARQHVLVCTISHPNPENKPYVNHKDGITWNNEPENLEWSTEQENTQHACLIGLMKFKLSVEQVKEIYESKEKWPNLAKKYEVQIQTIRKIKKGKAWAFLTGQNFERDTMPEKVLAIFNSDKPIGDLARLYDMHPKNIKRIKIGRIWSEITGLYYTPSKRKTLSKTQVLEIVNSGEREYILAEKYGVNQVTINDIKHGRSWSKLTGIIPKKIRVHDKKDWGTRRQRY